MAPILVAARVCVNSDSSLLAVLLTRHQADRVICHPFAWYALWPNRISFTFSQPLWRLLTLMVYFGVVLFWSHVPMRRDLIFCSEAWCKLSQRRCCNAVTPHSQYEHGVVQLESPFFVRIVTHQGRVGKRKIHTGVPTTAQGNARNDKRTALHVLPLPCFFSTLPARPPFLPALRHALSIWYSAPPPLS